jgi:hypothetical protein
MMSYIKSIKTKPPIYETSARKQQNTAIKVTDEQKQSSLFTNHRYSVYDNNYDEFNNRFNDNDYEMDGNLNNINEISSLSNSSSSSNATMPNTNSQLFNDNQLSDVLYSIPTKTTLTQLQEDNNKDEDEIDNIQENDNEDCKKEWEKVFYFASNSLSN